MPTRKPVPRVRAFDEAGQHAINPTRDQISGLIAGLGLENAYLVVERLGADGEPTEEFAQTAVPRPGSREWIVEYREGKRQFRAFSSDQGVVAETLATYANGGPDWRGKLEWSLFLTHGRG